MSIKILYNLKNPNGSYRRVKKKIRQLGFTDDFGNRHALHALEIGRINNGVILEIKPEDENKLKVFQEYGLVEMYYDERRHDYEIHFDGSIPEPSTEEILATLYPANRADIMDLLEPKKTITQSSSTITKEEIKMSTTKENQNINVQQQIDEAVNKACEETRKELEELRSLLSSVTAKAEQAEAEKRVAEQKLAQAVTQVKEAEEGQTSWSAKAGILGVGSLLGAAGAFALVKWLGAQTVNVVTETIE